MPMLSPADVAGILVFAAAWGAYHLFVERASREGDSLNARMNTYRLRWMAEMSRREQRMVDTHIMGSLQNGAAFFASSSLIAVGGAATLLKGADDAVKVLAELPLMPATARGLWELKVVGLAFIFGYAFFKFTWSYRLFNYAAILIGSTPAAHSTDAEARRTTALRAGQMAIVAGRHFARGQRAFLFAIAYLGWFLGPYAFMATTGAVLFVMWLRQFGSDARAATLAEPPDQGAGNSASVRPDSR